MAKLQHTRVTSASDTCHKYSMGKTKYKLDPILHMSHSLT